MRTNEMVSVLAFLAVVGLIYLKAGLLCIGEVRRRIRGDKPVVSKRKRLARRVVLTLAAIGIGCFAYAYFVEPYWPEVTTVRLSSDKIPAGVAPIRIAHISDLHCDGKARLESRLPEIIAAERPDAIVFTGDTVNSPAGVNNFVECMNRLAEIAPVYAVTGNWDHHQAIVDIRRRTKIQWLDNAWAYLPLGKRRIQILGTPHFGGDFAGIASAADTERFAMMLCHVPDVARDFPMGNVDLVCSGHTHGGQVALPLWGPLVTLTAHGDGRGLYEIGDTMLYVNRGIGMEGGHAPRVRFCSRPEITVYELTGKE